MSSLLIRGWIALAIVVTTPLAGFAQRSRNDADTYPEDDYGDVREESEPPRLFRGGLMHQLRSVTESVLGENEEPRPAPETNRNIPKPPPLASQSQRSAPGGRSSAQENSRADDASGSSAAPSRSWAGQFLVPNQRSRTPAAASRPTAPSERSGDRRVYLGGQRQGQPTATTRSGPSSAATEPRPNRTPTRSGQDAAASSGDLSLEASEPQASNDDVSEMNEGPAEVIVSHVPDVPYVPRKPLPNRPEQPAAGKSSLGASSSGGKSSTPTKAGTSPGAQPSTPSAKAPPALAQPNQGAVTLGTSGEPTLAADAPRAQLGSADRSSADMSPSVPSLESGLLAPSEFSTPSSAAAPKASTSAPSLPSFSPPEATSFEPGLTPPSSPQLSLPQSSKTSPSLSPAPSASTAAPATPSLPSAGSVSQERLHMEIPHVVVKLLGPGDLATGTPTAYELVVQNPDRIALSGLILRMETPPGVEIVSNPNWGDAVGLEKAEDGATLLLWNVAGVSAGGSTKLNLDLKTITARNFAVAIEWTVLPQEGFDELTVKQPDLQVALEGPVDVEKDIANVYRVRVSNPGNAAARNVKVQVGAASQQASEVEIGDLAAGQSEIVEMDLTFEKAGRLEINAHALADSLKRDTNIVVNVRQPVLQASLQVPKSVLLGDNVFATMELRNTGDAPARKVQAGLMIPAETEVINPPSGVTRQGDKLLWEIETVPPGQVVTVPIELRLANPGDQALKFACVTPSGSVSSAESSTTVEAFADLNLLVSDPPTPAPIGAPVVYEMTVTNRGTRDAHNVTILAQFSEGIEPQSAAGLNNRVVPGQVLFDPIPTIAAGETLKIKLTAKASVPGMHRFRAEVRCEENDARLVEEESTRYLESASRIASPPSTLIQR